MLFSILILHLFIISVNVYQFEWFNDYNHGIIGFVFYDRSNLEYE